MLECLGSPSASLLWKKVRKEERTAIVKGSRLQQEKAALRKHHIHAPGVRLTGRGHGPQVRALLVKPFLSQSANVLLRQTQSREEVSTCGKLVGREGYYSIHRNRGKVVPVHGICHLIHV